MCADQNIAVPTQRVELAIAQIGSYIPSDPSQDFLASSIGDSLSKCEMEGLIYDPIIEAIRFPTDPVKRNNYIAYEGVTYAERKPWSDSNLELEIKRRMWTPLPLPLKTSIFNGAFFKPRLNVPYPASYNGPRWSTSTFEEPTNMQFGSIEDKETIVYNSTDESESGGDNGTIESQDSAAFWLTQTTSSNFSQWRIKQVKPNFRNQPFTLHVKKSSVGANLSSNFLEIYAPSSGAYLAVFLGGGLDSFLTPLSSDQNNGEGGEENPEDENNEGFMTPPEYNGLVFVFPIDKPPYIIWTKKWAEAIDNPVPSALDGDGNKDPLDPFKIETNIDPNWILPDSISEFSLTFFPFSGKLAVQSSYCETPWIFPKDSAAAYRTILKIKTGKDISPQVILPPYEVEILEKELEIQGRGFKCSLNMTPMEFRNDGRPNTSREGIEQFPYIKFPYMQYAVGPGSGKQTLTTWGGDLSSPNALLLPGNYIAGSTLPKFGYDYNPNLNTTTHGLPPDCISVEVVEDFPAENPPPNLINVPGLSAALKSTSALSPFTYFKRFALVFNNTIPVDKEKIGSRVFCTPLFYRIKFKGRVSKISPNAESWIDITNHVQSITYSAKMDDCCFNKELTLNLIMPKQADSSRGSWPVENRMFWASLQRKHFLIRAFMGFDAATNNVPELLALDPETPYFTGVAWGGEMQYNNRKDTFSIRAVDLTEVLKDIPTMNSPWYDGMDLKYAIATTLERSGFSALSALETGDSGENSILEFSVSPRALPLSQGWVLPDSLNYANPTLRYSPGTKAFDIIKGFVSRFWLLFKATRQGGFQLDCWPGSDIGNTYGNAGDENYSNIRYVPTNALAPGQGNEFNAGPEYYTYYSMPTNVGEDFKGLYFLLKDAKIIRMKPSKWNNMFGIATINRESGGYEIVSDGDPDSIANPSAPNFIGFMKMGFSLQAGYGGKDAARNSLNLITNILFKPIMIVSATIWGNRLLEPLDIVKIDNNNFRIVDISAEMNVEGIPSFTMNITGENVNDSSESGQWRLDDPLNITG